MRSALTRILLYTGLAALLNVPFVNGSEPLVPGTGIEITKVGDDFEDPEWEYYMRGAKSSKEMDERTRLPAGESKNKRWYEGVKRGHPDIVRRVPTPEGGLEGSTGALLLRTLRPGIPGRLTHRMQQDDFICDVDYRLGGKIPVSKSPNFVVRVFLPPVDTWENRTGVHFGIRASLETRGREDNTYWPGMFIVFESKNEQRPDDYAYLRIRGDRRGRDYKSLQITQTGWWTFGMSVTPDGQVHYYAKPGIEDLTQEDHLGSGYPYGFRCYLFKTFFFDICTLDNGRTWSTPFVIDDAKMYYVNTGYAGRQPTRR